MIPLVRNRSPDFVPPVLRAPKVHEALAQLEASVRSGKPELNREIWSAARAQLRREALGKCAYCESRTDSVEIGDVEHFRPKSTWWWLAYFWGNYLYSCESCNRLYKRDRFPLDKAGRVFAGELRALPDPLCCDAEWRAFQKCLSRERPLLPNPYETDPRPLFRYEADAARGEVRMTPARRGGFARRSAEAAIEVYGLNREPLRRERWRVWRETQVLLESRDAIRSKALRTRIDGELEIAQSPDAEFSAMASWLIQGWPGTRAR